MSSPSPTEVLLDPSWIPHAVDHDAQLLTFVCVPRERRSELVFLTDSHLRGEYPRVSLPLASAAGVAVTGAPLHFIFHSSFCCSTLLARALAVEGTAASLSEPNILVNLAEQVMRTGLEGNRSRLKLVLDLLARPPAAGERVIVKASSFANGLIEPVLAARPEGRAVLLHSDLETFLAGVLKRGLLGRINARRLYQRLAPFSPLDFGFSAAETFEQTDLQVAALAWLLQIAQFGRLADRLGDRVHILGAADLLAQPRLALEKMGRLFGLGLSDQQLTAIVGGPAFAKHSKFTDVDYDPSGRERDHDALMKLHGEELRMVSQWLEAVAAHLRLELGPIAVRRPST
jgi:hypothetical protein